MKVPMSWLHDLVRLPEGLGAQEMAHAYTNLGLTVERIEQTGPTVTGPLVFGRVLSISDEPQKNGKTIRYCRVDVGDEHNDGASDEFPASRGIVCGAHNFEVGDTVVVSLPGTVLPGGFEISARKTYGHISDGMIVSELELGLGEDHDGIIVIPEALGHQPGEAAAPALWSSDEVLEIDVTPDLGYAMSMRGMAREAAIVADVAYHDRYDAPAPDVTTAGYPVELESDRTLNFAALTIEGFDPAAPTPDFMVQRLRASGVRSISLPVDVTNYVMLESGQPLHAYDAAKLQGPIRVRLARQGERLVTIDHQERVLDPDDLLITDDRGPIGMAGVMGGEDTEVSESTTSIVLEAAHFQPQSVSRTFRRHQLASEASKRFERTVDPRVTYAAAMRAAKLLVEHGGGQVLEEFTWVGSVPPRHKINMRSGLVSQILGAPVEQAETIAILEDSGVGVTALGDSLTLEIPSWRNDLRDPYDVIEEVGRHYGYDRIGLTLPVPSAGRGLTRAQRDRRNVVRAVAGMGFTELLTLPFTSDEELDRLGLGADDPRRAKVRLANPLSETHPYLRTSLLPGLFAAVAKNTSRGITDVAIFERGTGFFDFGTPDAPRPSVDQRPSDEEIAALDAALPTQAETLAAVVTGNWRPAGWQGEARPADWTHVVAFAETAAAAVGASLTRVQETDASPWHPGRCAKLMVGDKVLGFAGELHPAVVKAFELPARTCAVEFNLGDLIAAAPATLSIPALSTFPVAKEDVALIVDDEVAAADVQRALVEGAGELLESAHLFDVYTGDQVGQGRKSLAFGLRFRGDTTLTDAQTAEARQAAVRLAAERFGAVQRS